MLGTSFNGSIGITLLMLRGRVRSHSLRRRPDFFRKLSETYRKLYSTITKSSINHQVLNHVKGVKKSPLLPLSRSTLPSIGRPTTSQFYISLRRSTTARSITSQTASSRNVFGARATLNITSSLRRGATPSQTAKYTNGPTGPYYTQPGSIPPTLQLKETKPPDPRKPLSERFMRISFRLIKVGAILGASVYFIKKVVIPGVLMLAMIYGNDTYSDIRALSMLATFMDCSKTQYILDDNVRWAGRLYFTYHNLRCKYDSEYRLQRLHAFIKYYPLLCQALAFNFDRVNNSDEIDSALHDLFYRFNEYDELFHPALVRLRNEYYYTPDGVFIADPTSFSIPSGPSGHNYFPPSHNPDNYVKYKSAGEDPRLAKLTQEVSQLLENRIAMQTQQKQQYNDDQHAATTLAAIRKSDQKKKRKRRASRPSSGEPNPVDIPDSTANTFDPEDYGLVTIGDLNYIKKPMQKADDVPLYNDTSNDFALAGNPWETNLVEMFTMASLFDLYDDYGRDFRVNAIDNKQSFHKPSKEEVVTKILDMIPADFQLKPWIATALMRSNAVNQHQHQSMRRPSQEYNPATDDNYNRQYAGYKDDSRQYYSHLFSDRALLNEDIDPSLLPSYSLERIHHVRERFEQLMARNQRQLQNDPYRNQQRAGLGNYYKGIHPTDENNTISSPYPSFNYQLYKPNLHKMAKSRDDLAVDQFRLVSMIEDNFTPNQALETMNIQMAALLTLRLYFQPLYYHTLSQDSLVADEFLQKTSKHPTLAAAFYSQARDVMSGARGSFHTVKAHVHDIIKQYEAIPSPASADSIEDGGASNHSAITQHSSSPHTNAAESVAGLSKVQADLSNIFHSGSDATADPSGATTTSKSLLGSTEVPGYLNPHSYSELMNLVFSKKSNYTAPDFLKRVLQYYQDSPLADTIQISNHYLYGLTRGFKFPLHMQTVFTFATNHKNINPTLSGPTPDEDPLSESLLNLAAFTPQSVDFPHLSETAPIGTSAKDFAMDQSQRIYALEIERKRLQDRINAALSPLEKKREYHEYVKFMQLYKQISLDRHIYAYNRNYIPVVGPDGTIQDVSPSERYEVKHAIDAQTGKTVLKLHDKISAAEQTMRDNMHDDSGDGDHELENLEEIRLKMISKGNLPYARSTDYEDEDDEDDDLFTILHKKNPYLRVYTDPNHPMSQDSTPEKPHYPFPSREKKSRSQKQGETSISSPTSTISSSPLSSSAGISQQSPPASKVEPTIPFSDPTKVYDKFQYQRKMYRDFQKTLRNYTIPSKYRQKYVASQAVPGSTELAHIFYLIDRNLNQFLYESQRILYIDHQNKLEKERYPNKKQKRRRWGGFKSRRVDPNVQYIQHAIQNETNLHSKLLSLFDRSIFTKDASTDEGHPDVDLDSILSSIVSYKVKSGVSDVETPAAAVHHSQPQHLRDLKHRRQMLQTGRLSRGKRTSEKHDPQYDFLDTYARRVELQRTYLAHKQEAIRTHEKQQRQRAAQAMRHSLAEKTREASGDANTTRQENARGEGLWSYLTSLIPGGGSALSNDQAVQKKTQSSSISPSLTYNDLLKLANHPSHDPENTAANVQHTETSQESSPTEELDHAFAQQQLSLDQRLYTNSHVVDDLVDVVLDDPLDLDYNKRLYDLRDTKDIKIPDSMSDEEYLQHLKEELVYDEYLETLPADKRIQLLVEEYLGSVPDAVDAGTSKPQNMAKGFKDVPNTLQPPIPPKPQYRFLKGLSQPGSLSPSEAMEHLLFEISKLIENGKYDEEDITSAFQKQLSTISRAVASQSGLFRPFIHQMNQDGTSDTTTSVPTSHSHPVYLRYQRQQRSVGTGSYDDATSDVLLEPSIENNVYIKRCRGSSGLTYYVKSKSNIPYISNPSTPILIQLFQLAPYMKTATRKDIVDVLAELRQYKMLTDIHGKTRTDKTERQPIVDPNPLISRIFKDPFDEISRIRQMHASRLLEEQPHLGQDDLDYLVDQTLLAEEMMLLYQSSLNTSDDENTKNNKGSKKKRKSRLEKHGDADSTLSLDAIAQIFDRRIHYDILSPDEQQEVDMELQLQHYFKPHVALLPYLASSGDSRLYTENLSDLELLSLGDDELFALAIAQNMAGAKPFFDTRLQYIVDRYKRVYPLRFTYDEDRDRADIQQVLQDSENTPDANDTAKQKAVLTSGLYSSHPLIQDIVLDLCLYMSPTDAKKFILLDFSHPKIYNEAEEVFAAVQEKIVKAPQNKDRLQFFQHIRALLKEKEHRLDEGDEYAEHDSAYEILNCPLEPVITFENNELDRLMDYQLRIRGAQPKHGDAASTAATAAITPVPQSTDDQEVVLDNGSVEMVPTISDEQHPHDSSHHPGLSDTTANADSQEQPDSSHHAATDLQDYGSMEKDMPVYEGVSSDDEDDHIHPDVTGDDSSMPAIAHPTLDTTPDHTELNENKESSSWLSSIFSFFRGGSGPSAIDSVSAHPHGDEDDDADEDVSEEDQDLGDIDDDNDAVELSELELMEKQHELNRLQSLNFHLLMSELHDSGADDDEIDPNTDLDVDGIESMIRNE